MEKTKVVKVHRLETSCIRVEFNNRRFEIDDIISNDILMGPQFIIGSRTGDIYDLRPILNNTDIPNTKYLKEGIEYVLVTTKEQRENI